MNKKRGGSWWRRLPWRRRPARSAADDFADMGTVFGLEASLAAADPARAQERNSAPAADAVAQRLKGRSVR